MVLLYEIVDPFIFVLEHARYEKQQVVEFLVFFGGVVVDLGEHLSYEIVDFLFVEPTETVLMPQNDGAQQLQQNVILLVEETVPQQLDRKVKQL